MPILRCLEGTARRRLVPARRFWLARWRAYHALRGPRPPPLEVDGVGPCACGAGRRPPPLWLDRVFRLDGGDGAADVSRRRGDDAAAAAEALEAARAIDDVVYDCVREHPEPAACAEALAGLADAYRGSEGAREAVAEDEYQALLVHYPGAAVAGGDVDDTNAERCYPVGTGGWVRAGPPACAACARREIENHGARRDAYDDAPLHVVKMKASDLPPPRDADDDVMGGGGDDGDDGAGDGRRRSRRASKDATKASVETVKLGSDDRVGLLLLKLCEAPRADTRPGLERRGYSSDGSRRRRDYDFRRKLPRGGSRGVAAGALGISTPRRGCDPPPTVAPPAPFDGMFRPALRAPRPSEGAATVPPRRRGVPGDDGRREEAQVRGRRPEGAGAVHRPRGPGFATF